MAPQLLDVNRSLMQKWKPRKMENLGLLEMMSRITVVEVLVQLRVWKQFVCSPKIRLNVSIFLLSGCSLEMYTQLRGLKLVYPKAY